LRATGKAQYYLRANEPSAKAGEEKANAAPECSVCGYVLG